MQIGCIECGVSSYPIKTADTFKEAHEIAVKHPSTWKSEGGDGHVMIIDLDTFDVKEIYDGDK